MQNLSFNDHNVDQSINVKVCEHPKQTCHLSDKVMHTNGYLLRAFPQQVLPLSFHQRSPTVDHMASSASL